MNLSDDLLAEYSQAGALFRDGFGTISNIIKSYVTINGILLTAFGLTYRFVGEGLQSTLIIAICLIGVAAAAITAVVHRRMTLYLRSWVQRAAKIENGTELRLFTETAEIERSSRRNLFQTYAVMIFTYVVVGISWLLVLTVSQDWLQQVYNALRDYCYTY